MQTISNGIFREMEHIVIFCCGAYHEADYTYFLEPNERFKVRRLEILLECPSKNENCHAYIAELSQIEQNSNVFSVKRYKNQKAKKFVEKLLKKSQYEIFQIPKGSKNGMNWIYGENCEIKNKKGELTEIHQKAVDFNNKKKLSNLSIFLLITPLHNKWKDGLLCSFFYQKQPEYSKRKVVNYE